MLDIQEPVTASTPVDDPVSQIRIGVVALAEEDRSDWTASAKSERLVEVLEIKERLDAEILRLAGSWDRDRAWEIDGSLSPRAWLAHRTPLSDADAGRLVKHARIVTQHEPIASSLRSGEITAQHVDAISRVTSKDREPLLAEHAEMLVDQARRLVVRDFATVMRHWASLADDQLSREPDARKWNRRHLHASVGMDGWVRGDFHLDPGTGASLLTALDHAAPPDPEDAPDGVRTLAQRRADGLADIVNQHMNGGKPGANPPQVVAVVDIASAAGKTPDLAATRREIEGIGPVARAAIDQISCDARFTRFIMDGPSQVLDMGRSARLVTSAQRRALSVRDRHCRFPSCSRPTQWCDAHHVAGWVESLGDTNIDNLVLLCRRHHTLLHNSRWEITSAADGGFEFSHPARGP